MKLKPSVFWSLAAICGVLGLAVALYPELPESIPIHFDPEGNADGFAPKLRGVALAVGLPLVVFALLKMLPRISPGGFRLDGFQRVVDIIALAVTLTLCGISMLMLLSAAGREVPLAALRPVLIGGLFVVLGNFMGKVRKNFFIGIRTPWTLASDEVWARTHRIGGWLFVLAGIAILTTVAAPEHFTTVLLASVGAAALVSVAYSFIVYLKLQRSSDGRN